MKNLTEKTQGVESETIVLDGRKIEVKKPKSLLDLEPGDVVRIDGWFHHKEIVRFEGYEFDSFGGTRAVFLHQIMPRNFRIFGDDIFISKIRVKHLGCDTNGQITYKLDTDVSTRALNRRIIDGKIIECLEYPLLEKKLQYSGLAA